MAPYFCPRCSFHAISINLLSCHLKLKHSSSSYEAARCKQDGCIRIFGDVYSFKKHLKYKHLTPVDVVPLVNQRSRNNIEKNDDHNSPATSTEPLSTTEFQSENYSVPNFSDLKRAVTESASTFISKLHCNPNITKAAIHGIINSTSELFNSGFIDILKKVHTDSITSGNADEFNRMLDLLLNPFDGLETEYKREKYMVDAGYLIRPTAFFVGVEKVPKKINNVTTVNLKNLTGQIMPLRIIFKKFLELPNVLTTMETYINDCMSETKITSFLNGQLWLKQRKNFPDKFVIPLMLFFDDLEINNPLGSHKGVNKIGAVYCRMLTVPPQYSSMTENIFAAQFHKSCHLQNYGNKNIFEPLVEELKFLENTGIIVNTSHGDRKIYFTLSLFAGDNLGVHTVFGFHESFRSNYYCHLCRLPKKFLDTSLIEDSSKLRTKENFQQDVIDCEHGIKNNTVFHELPYFHITENIYCDVMHDMLEGICRYVLPNVLNILVYTDMLFTVDTLNDRIRFFNCSKSVPLISKDALQKGIFICSASEMKLLLENLGLIIGDLVPKYNAAWELYVTLREIQCLLAKNYITEKNLETLRTHIAKHHRLYQELMEEPLKPKFHFLTHYPTVIRNIGPIYAVSCMRMEGKHKEFKENAQVIRSRKNICYSLATRNQLSYAERLQAKKGFQPRLKLGASATMKHYELPSYETFKSFITESQLTDYNHIVSYAQINGTNYKLNMILVVNEDDNSTKFGKIMHILVNMEYQVAFILLILRTTEFSKHIHSFVVEETTEWCMKTYSDLDHYKPRNLHTLTDGKTYVGC